MSLTYLFLAESWLLYSLLEMMSRYGIHGPVHANIDKSLGKIKTYYEKAINLKTCI